MSSPFAHLPVGFTPLPEGAEALAQRAGLPFLTLDLAHVETRATLMDRLGRTLSLPDYFGRNWDALYDLLSDAERQPACALCLRSLSAFRRVAPLLADQLEDVLQDAQAELRAAGKGLWLFVEEAPGSAGGRPRA